MAMKSLSLFCALALFAVASLVHAQDAPSRPFKSPSPVPREDQPLVEPTPLPATNESESAPTPEATATPEQEKVTPTPREERTPRPEPTATPKPAATSTAAPVSKPTAAPKSTAPPKPTAIPKAAGTPVKRVAQKKESNLLDNSDTGANQRTSSALLKKLEKTWEASFNDPDVVEKYLAEDFVGTSPSGKMVNKKFLLQEARSDKSPPPDTSAHTLDVHFFGRDIAVVTGGARQMDKNRAGQKVRHDFRFTDTWVLRNGKWQCVASQAVLVPSPSR